MNLNDRLKELRNLYPAILSLTVKDLKKRYGESYLGFFWSLLEPLGIIAVYSLVFPLVLDMNFLNWVIYFIAGLIPFRFLSTGITEVTRSLVGNRNILSHLNVSPAILPLSVGLSHTVSFLLECSILLLILVLTGVVPNFLVIFFPLLVLCQVMIVIGVGFYLARLFVSYRDLSHILKIVFKALFFLSPIVYRLEMIPTRFQNFYLANPIARLILLYQSIILYPLNSFIPQIPPLSSLLLLFLSSATILAIGWWDFCRHHRSFIDKL